MLKRTIVLEGKTESDLRVGLNKIVSAIENDETEGQTTSETVRCRYTFTTEGKEEDSIKSVEPDDRAEAIDLLTELYNEWLIKENPLHEKLKSGLQAINKDYYEDAKSELFPLMEECYQKRYRSAALKIDEALEKLFPQAIKDYTEVSEENAMRKEAIQRLRPEKLEPVTPMNELESIRTHLHKKGFTAYAVGLKTALIDLQQGDKEGGKKQLLTLLKSANNNGDNEAVEALAPPLIQMYPEDTKRFQ